MRKYYICHPFETYGDPTENLRKEESLVSYLRNTFDLEVQYIRPFKLIPTDTDRETAMKRCLELVAECDGIILAPDWHRSEGCVMEFQQAEKLGKEIVYVLDQSTIPNRRKGKPWKI